VAEWFTPSGDAIGDSGIKPDILIEDDQTTEVDEQLDKAIQELNKLITN